MKFLKKTRAIVGELPTVTKKTAGTYDSPSRSYNGLKFTKMAAELSKFYFQSRYLRNEISQKKEVFGIHTGTT